MRTIETVYTLGCITAFLLAFVSRFIEGLREAKETTESPSPDIEEDEDDWPRSRRSYVGCIVAGVIGGIVLGLFAAITWPIMALGILKQLYDIYLNPNWEHPYGIILNILAKTGREMMAREIVEASQKRLSLSGTYGHLSHMHDEGLVLRRREARDPDNPERPRHTYWRISDKGGRRRGEFAGKRIDIRLPGGIRIPT